MPTATASTTFEQFVVRLEPQLRRALSGHLPPDAVPDALAEAFTYAWEHWDRVQGLDSPGGYLFRVAQSSTRRRRDGALPPPGPAHVPEIEPGLVDALRALPDRQRSAVWLVHGCGFTSVDAAEALGISASAVATHLARGMARLRTALGVNADE